VLTGARPASARTSAATRGHTAAGRSCPTPGSRTSRAPSIAAYLAHALQAGQHPRLAELLAADPAGRNAPTGPAGAESPDQSTPDEGTPTGATPDGGTPDGGMPDPYPDIMARVLTGLLAPA
jgi:hypothetical protein